MNIAGNEIPGKYIAIGAILVLILVIFGPMLNSSPPDPKEQRKAQFGSDKLMLHLDEMQHKDEKGWSGMIKSLRGGDDEAPPPVVNNGIPTPETATAPDVQGAPGGAAGYVNPGDDSPASPGYAKQYYGKPVVPGEDATANSGGRAPGGYYPPPPLPKGDTTGYPVDRYGPRSFNQHFLNSGEQIHFAGIYVFSVDEYGRNKPLHDGIYRLASGLPLFVEGGKKIISK